jgi:halimadienyl-diphosphate synthase
MDYIEEAKELVRNLDQRMGPSPYDIAWMARVKDSDGNPRWPELIEWLLENQRPDGSWGGEIEYYHDRIICTLVAAMALYENGSNARTTKSIKEAETYLWHTIHRLPRDPYELVGFELILPTLLAEAKKIGLDVPNHTCGYGKIQTEKLKLIPPSKLYSPYVSTVYSLEFLGRNADREQLKRAVGPNGSIGNSPATTAYYLLLNPSDDRAIKYLESIKANTDNVVTVYPFRVFEAAWVLNNLSFSNLPIREIASPENLESLLHAITPNGTGFDQTFTVPDGDTTSVSCSVLLKSGYEVNHNILRSFENKRERFFRTYEYERNASVGTNVHALEALRLMRDYPNISEIREKIILMLLNQRKYNMYWTDKWHASPYYATAHTLIALLKEGAYLAHTCRESIDWLIHTQQADGSWGFFGQGTLEETSYVITALLHYSKIDIIDEAIIHCAMEYLERNHKKYNACYPELWIAKPLYTPVNIVRSTILSALILYNSYYK